MYKNKVLKHLIMLSLKTFKTNKEDEMAKYLQYGDDKDKKNISSKLREKHQKKKKRI